MRLRQVAARVVRAHVAVDSLFDVVAELASGRDKLLRNGSGRDRGEWRKLVDLILEGGSESVVRVAGGLPDARRLDRGDLVED